MRPQAFWSLLQPLLHPTPERFAFCTDVGAVEECSCYDAEALTMLFMPMQLFVAEAG
jgi:hypothetical protein